jgi:hypothetical protein
MFWQQIKYFELLAFHRAENTNRKYMDAITSLASSYAHNIISILTKKSQGQIQLKIKVKDQAHSAVKQVCVSTVHEISVHELHLGKNRITKRKKQKQKNNVTH